MSSQETEEKTYKLDWISTLPEDLLVHILSLVPTKDAVTTMLLSKRWHFVWAIVPKLDYMVTYKSKNNFSDFIDKSMQHHKAPVLESFRIRCDGVIPDGVYVRKWVSNAVYRGVRELTLEIYSGSNPNNLPSCLYTSKTLVKLSLCNILIDVPPQACLPSLQSLTLNRVVYKDIDSQSKLLSSCPILKDLLVSRDSDSNEPTIFNVKIPCLERLTYMSYGVKGSGNFLVIDSPRLHQLTLGASSKDDCSIQNMPHLDKASVHLCFGSHQNGKLLRSISSVKYLRLYLNEVTFCSAINFSRLIELQIFIFSFCLVPNWLETLVLLLNNTPKLKVLMINNDYNNAHQLSWNQPSSVPPCLLSHLEIFEWKGFEGLSKEKEFVAYIFSNSKCLKTAGISSKSLYNNVRVEKKNIEEELESMYRVSASSKLLFSAKLKWIYSK